MTTGKLIPFDVALQREDRRLEDRKKRDDNVRRKLLPLIVIVCETYRVHADDLLDSSNRHPTVVLARDIIRWLGYTKFHVGSTYLAVVLNNGRVASTRDFLQRVRKKMATSAEFRRQVACVETLLDAQAKK